MAGIGVLLRYEQVHRFVDEAPMTETRFMNASGFSAWVVLWGKALDPKLSIGIRMQSRDDTDAAFFNAPWGVALP